MPSRLASGANTCSDSRATLGGHRLLAWPRASAASAGARPGAASPPAGRARTPAASCARSRSACPASSTRCARAVGRARLLLHVHQLGGFDRQRGVVVAEDLGDHLLRPVQVLAGIDQVAGRLHRLGAAHATRGWRPPHRHAPACSRRCPASRRRSAARRRRGRAPARSPDRGSASLGRGRSAAGSLTAALTRLRCRTFHRRRRQSQQEGGDGLDLRRRRPRSAHGRRLRIRPARARGPRSRHGERRLARQQVGLAPRSQQRRGADAVVQLPQRGLGLRRGSSVVSARNGTAMAGS